jgi:hypothetical protein
MKDMKVLEALKETYKAMMAESESTMAWSQIEVDGKEAWISIADEKTARFFMQLLEEGGATKKIYEDNSNIVVN